MAAFASASPIARPAVQGLSARSPVTARAAPKAVRCQAQKEQQRQQVNRSSSVLTVQHCSAGGRQGWLRLHHVLRGDACSEAT
jgi:hypothetical protein